MITSLKSAFVKLKQCTFIQNVISDDFFFLCRLVLSALPVGSLVTDRTMDYNVDFNENLLPLSTLI